MHSFQSCLGAGEDHARLGEECTTQAVLSGWEEAEPVTVVWGSSPGSPVLEGLGTVGAGRGGGVLGSRQQEQRPRVEPPGRSSEHDCSFLAWEAGCVGVQSEPDWGGKS